MSRAGVRRRWPILGLTCVAIVTGIASAGAWLLKSPPPSPLQRGMTAYRSHDWPSAEKGAREHLKSHADDPAGLSLLTRALLQQKRDEPALALYERLGESRLEAEDFFLLGHSLLRSGRRQSALQVWYKAVDKDPNDYRVWLALAQVFFQMDSLSEAAVAADKLADQPGWKARAHLMLGQIRVAQSDPAAAAQAYQVALDHLDDWQGMDDVVRVRKQQARLLLQLGKPGEARAELRPLAGDDPETCWLVTRCDLQEGTPSDESVSALAHSFRESHPVEREPAAFVGEGRCAECHQPIFQEQHRSRHARTLPRGEQFRTIPFPEKPIPDPVNAKVTHSFARNQDQIQVRTEVDGQVFQTIVDYAFGSGDRGLTLVGHDPENRSYEYRLSFYSQQVGWDVTAGHPADPALPAALYQGMPMTADAIRRCFECHATNPHSVLTNSGPESSDRAIGCELCHGPGANHLKVLASLKGGASKLTHLPKDVDLAIARPALTSGSEIVALCGRCHSPRPNLVKLSPGSPDSIRFQGATLTWSRCYTESGNRLDCVTCHDPHRNLVTSAGWYESRCLQCHATGGVNSERIAKTACPVNSTTGCINCHMPSVSTVMSHSRFTDHFIRVHRDSEPVESHAVKPSP